MDAWRRTGWRVLFVVGLVAVTAGCIGLADEDLEQDAAASDVARETWYTDDVEWDTEGNYSSVLSGTAGYDVLEVERLDFAADDGTEIEVAVWRPDVPDGEEVPVIMDAGPYYGAGIEQLGAREETFFLENFVEDGFAYARMAVRGTAGSGGCMEFFGEREQADVDQAVTEVGTAEWSNGNVALYGASYDGTTPWVAAAHGNEHLETIVPVSGLTDVAELMFRNGTSETRGPIMHSFVYWAGIGVPDSADAGQPQEQACAEALQGSIAGPYTTVTGDREPVNDDSYWEIRDWRDRVRENYDGSVFLVHGLQDSNVETSMSYPYVNTLEDDGFEVKHMLGQWGHDWPDRAEREDASVRYDWAEMLHRWFDHELRSTTSVDTGPGAHVQDNLGDWRAEDTWPPEDVSWETWNLGDGVLTEQAPEGGSAYLASDLGTGVLDTLPEEQVDGVTDELVFELEGPGEELRFSGLPRLHVQVTPHSPEGGQLAAELVDTTEDEQVALAVMDLRYHAGGTERQELAPGETVTARMEFFPVDVVLPEDHELELRITADAPGRVPSHAADPVELHWGEDSQLHLPTIERDGVDGTYPGQPT